MHVPISNLEFMNIDQQLIRDVNLLIAQQLFF